MRASHVTTIERGESGISTLGGRLPRFRWVCSCEVAGPWTAVECNANRGAGKHVAMLHRGRAMGCKIEEHW